MSSPVVPIISWVNNGTERQMDREEMRKLTEEEISQRIWEGVEAAIGQRHSSYLATVLEG